MSEVHLIYNREDGKYYTYDGETYIADSQTLPDGLQYFLPLITEDVTILNIDENEFTKTYGKVVTHRRPGV